MRYRAMVLTLCHQEPGTSPLDDGCDSSEYYGALVTRLLFPRKAAK